MSELWGKTLNLDREYRPKDWDEFIGNEEIVRDMKSFLNTGDAPHLMFVGDPGTGKTSMAYLFASKYFEQEISIDTNDNFEDFKEINASDERGIDTVRTTIKNFAKTRASTPEKRRIMLVNEVDSTTREFQHAMRTETEKYEHNCIFIFTMNRIEGIKEPALISRCAKFYFKKPPMEKMASHFKKIANDQGVYFADDQIPLDVAEYYNGDLRHILTDCLESLRGFENKENITKQDIYKVYSRSGKSIAKKVAESSNQMRTFFEIYKKDVVNVREFLKEYFQILGEDAYPYAKYFAIIDGRIRDGCDPVIQLSALFLELEGEEKNENRTTSW